jgi:hypothetical protein
MPEPPERIRLLAHEFDALVENLNECQSLKKRKQLLQRMKILIDEIDVLVLSTVRGDEQDTIVSPPPDQRTAES